MHAISINAVKRKNYAVGGERRRRSQRLRHRSSIEAENPGTIKEVGDACAAEMCRRSGATVSTRGSSWRPRPCRRQMPAAVGSWEAPALQYGEADRAMVRLLGRCVTIWRSGQESGRSMSIAWERPPRGTVLMVKSLSLRRWVAVAVPQAKSSPRHHISPTTRTTSSTCHCTCRDSAMPSLRQRETVLLRPPSVPPETLATGVSGPTIGEWVR